MNREKHLPPSDFSDRAFEDVRTIPDFYDNLYPSAERQPDGKPMSNLQNSSKKQKSVRNNEKHG